MVLYKIYMQMKSDIFLLDILSPYQAMKEVTVNNSLSKIENLLFKAASAFVEIDYTPQNGEIVIDKRDGSVLYCANGEVMRCRPQKYQLLFVVASAGFFCFDGVTWVSTNSYNS